MTDSHLPHLASLLTLVVSSHQQGAIPQNLSARVQNPLQGVPRSKLLADVESFAEKHGLQDEVEILKKGAVLAQSPHDFERLDLLDDADKEAIRYEMDHKSVLLWWSLGSINRQHADASNAIFM